MTRKEINPSRAVHRIDLSLPIVQPDSYEIISTIPSSYNLRTTLRQKLTNQPARHRSPPRLKHLLGPAFVNFVVDTNSMTAETTSTMTDTVSNPLINSSNPTRLLKVLPTLNKRKTKQKNVKDDSDRSRSSSDNRLLYDSFGSFDDQNKHKAKNNNIWQNIHHPQLTSTKALHTRRMSKRSIVSNDTQVKASNTTSFDTLSQESTDDQLCGQIEQLTKHFFPTIQQIRHSRPNPELINNRMRLHRVYERNFMPLSSRTRAVR